MPLDVDILVLKIYTEFSVSSKIIIYLKDYRNFLELKYDDIIQHMAKKWLPLLKSLDKIVNALLVKNIKFVPQVKEDAYKFI